MAEEIKIVIGADVNQAISNIGKFNAKLGDTDDIVSDVISTSKNLDDALDKLGKQGLVSINSLEQSIGDFKTAFANATDPEDIKKFGDALVVLKKRQQDLINTGLPESLDKVTHSSGGGIVATQRLSASVLGLSNHLGVLPPELAGLTHGFDQLIQAFERVTHGSDSAGDKVTKFAGVLGQVGLGLAISVAIGLLVDLVKELFSTDAALEQVTQTGSELSLAFDKMNKSIAENKDALGFIQDLSETFADIQFGTGFESKLAVFQSKLSSLKEEAKTLGAAFETTASVFEGTFARMLGNVSEKTAKIIQRFGTLSNIPDAVIKKLDDVDKGLIENAKEAFDNRLKAQSDFNKNIEAQLAQEAKIKQLRADDDREKEKKKTDALRAEFESRQNIIKEFTAKFASIKDPFPSFFTKNLPLGKVEDKALRAALENSFKVLEQASRDLFNTKRIDPGTIPIEIKFKPEIAGRSELVRQIEEKFGDISKEVADAVNKGIFEVPVDFKIAPEGDGKALKILEDRFLDLGKAIESVTGQRAAIVNFHFNTNLLDEAKKLKVLDDVQQRIAEFASGTPLEVEVDANFEVNAKVDFKRVTTQLKQQISDALLDIQSNIATSFGEAIGNAISGLGNAKDAFGAVFNFLSEGIKSVGVALIKIGLLAEGIQKALAALSVQPELALALGIAFVALSQILKNSFQAREKGGTVAAGISYLVNEKGREIFQPNTGSPYWIEGGPQMFKPKTSGKIIPAPLTASFAKMFADRFNMPKFETGGLISGPVFGLLGEGSSISAINPEVIAPLETLKNLLPDFHGRGIDVRVTGSISNRTIKLGQAREGRSNRRNT